MSKFTDRQCAAKNTTEPSRAGRTKSNFLQSRNNADAQKTSDIWLITLSDLLMLLVIFFVILFSLELQKRIPTNSAHAAAKQIAAANKAQTANTEASLPGMSVSVEKDLAFIVNSEEIAIKRADNLVTLTFPERIIFDQGHAEVKPSAQETLHKVASFIRERTYLIVEVQGHTDDQPINTVHYPSNWDLSVDRATHVAKALIGMGVNPLQLSVKGFGEYRSLHPNDSDENRLKNRRVEIQFSPVPGIQGKACL